MGVKIFCKDDLGKVITELLDLPAGVDSRVSEGYKIAGAVIKAIKTALKDKKKVVIAGFGTFYVKEWSQALRPVSYFHNNKFISREYTTFPKYRVKFIPSRSLIKMLNEEPNE